ncbi:MAG: tetratricopeptide repeat protein [Planctomycetes bacterium]|nr:tetratricopeptide repeat protein [Planctomycetota bacterium]
MDQAPPPPEVYEYEPSGGGWYGIPSWGYLVYTVFWVWMMVDAYRRYGLGPWMLILFFFNLSSVVYFVIHARSIFTGTLRGGGDGPGLFGLGLRAKIRKAEQQMRMADTPAAREELAELYYQAKRYSDCETLFKRALEYGENAEAHYYVGLCRLAQNDAAGAFPHFEKVMAADKKLRFGLAWWRYAECLRALGRVPEALEELRQLHRAFPRPLTEFAYARGLAEAGEKEKARRVIEEMLATSQNAPREDRVYLSEGRTLLKTLG